MAERGLEEPGQSRAAFAQISRLTRDLVAALHETVWTVNPENDNLEELGNFLCQIAIPCASRAAFAAGCIFPNCRERRGSPAKFATMSAWR
jgi:hypothetical protein